MTVAVAHQGSSNSNHILVEAVREAHSRGEKLVVIHVRESLDEDLEAAVRAGVGDALERATIDAGVPAVPHETHFAPGGSTDVADAVLDAANEVGATLLVIGARHRSPVGKAFLGSASQQLILGATMPVLVVKPPR